MEPIDRRLLLGAAGLAGFAALSSVSRAGPLNPPAGPVAGSGKTTQEIFDRIGQAEPRIAVGPSTTPGDAGSVFRITQPGSYYLPGPVAGAAGKVAVRIDASDVTLDLNGFTITGVASGDTGVAVFASTIARVVVRNGVVRNSATGGVVLNGGGTPDGSRIESVIAQGCGVGLRVGEHGAILDSSAIDCASGIVTSSNCIIRGCLAANCTSAGIASGGGNLVTASTAAGCAAGFTLGSNGVALDCISQGNTQNGFVALTGCVLQRCMARANGLAGFLLSQSFSHITECTATGNTRGFQATASGNVFTRNLALSNSTANFDLSTGNRFGPVVPMSSGSVTGSSAASTLGSTDPWANFTA